MYIRVPWFSMTTRNNINQNIPISHFVDSGAARQSTRSVQVFLIVSNLWRRATKTVQSSEWQSPTVPNYSFIGQLISLYGFVHVEAPAWQRYDNNLTVYQTNMAFKRMYIYFTLIMFHDLRL